MANNHTPTVQRMPSPVAAYERDLPIMAAFHWLQLGWRDVTISAYSSLVYGLTVAIVSIGLVTALFEFGFSYILFPVIAGFMVVGPVIAVGLYEKSRLIAAGADHVSLREMIFVKAKSPGQLIFVGVLQMLLMTFWLRAAVMLYALFFGLHPFGGVEETVDTLFFTATGQSLLLVGSAVGGVLAAFAFSISAFSIPMLLNERKDTLTAMALSVAIAWANKPVVFLWGCIVLALFLLSVATGFLGLIIVFPVLGHGTWHAYIAMRGDKAPGAPDAA